MKKSADRGKKKVIPQQELAFVLNGKKVSCLIEPSMLLLDLIRDGFRLKGTKSGCREGECGSCCVLVDGAPIDSCLYLAVNADGKTITTIEGLQREDGTLDPVQESMVQHGAVQCGFCSPGMAMTVKALVNSCEKKLQGPEAFRNTAQGATVNEIPSKNEIKKWLEGNLCRCSGYVKIVDAADAVIRKVLKLPKPGPEVAGE